VLVNSGYFIITHLVFNLVTVVSDRSHTYQPLQWRNQDLKPDFKECFVFSQVLKKLLICW